MSLPTQVAFACSFDEVGVEAMPMNFAGNKRLLRLHAELGELLFGRDVNAAKVAAHHLSYVLSEFALRHVSESFNRALALVRAGWYVYKIEKAGKVTVANYDGHSYSSGLGFSSHRVPLIPAMGSPALEMNHPLMVREVLQHVANLTEELDIHRPIGVYEVMHCAKCDQVLPGPHEQWHMVEMHPDVVLERLRDAGAHKEAEEFAYRHGLTVP